MSCKVMDKHLRVLAPQILTAKFLRINAAKAPFFVAKLKIKVLPSLAMFEDGVLCGRQTGFEGLVSSANEQDFPTFRLKFALRQAGMMGEAAVRKAADNDEEDEEGLTGAAGAGGGAGDFAARLAMAREAMLQELDDEDDL
jgi:hypothetical protein